MEVDPNDRNGHITFHTFGRGELQETHHFDTLVFEMGAVRPVTAELMTRRAYHRDYGICDHADEDPIDLMRLHPKEDIIEGGPRRTWQRKYFNYRLGEITRLNILEFFQLPYSDALFYMEMAESTSVQESIAGRQAARDLQNLGG